MAKLLEGNLYSGDGDNDQSAGSSKKSSFGNIFNLIFFPIIFTNAAVRLTLFFFLNMVLGPCMALVWRTRKYLADAASVQITRSPNGLANALQRLGGDSTEIPGGGWTEHLFVVAPGRDSSVGGRPPSPEELGMFQRTWVETAGSGAPDAADAPIADASGLREQFIATQKAARRGDSAALARLAAFAAAISRGQAEQIQGQIPNQSDIAAALHGDRAAIARLQATERLAPKASGEKQESHSLQSNSIISFHPSLKRRLKRLERMGADVQPGITKRKSVPLTAIVILLITVPPLVVAGALLLVLIGIMIMANLVFLAVWLAAIHWIFQFFVHS